MLLSVVAAFGEHRSLAAGRTTGMLALPLLDAVEQAGNTGTDLGPLTAQVGDVVLQIRALGIAFPQGFLQGKVVRFLLIVFIEKLINILFEALQFRRIVHDTFLEL